MDQTLVAFVSVVEAGSFTGAAERLHLTQPAISQHVRSLERRLGARLLERGRNGVLPNRAGEIVYQHCREILMLNARMQRLVHDLQSAAQGPLAIGASFTFGEYVLPAVLASFLKAHPAVVPTVAIGNSASVAEGVLAMRLDVGIVEAQLQFDGLLIETLGEDQMVLIAQADSGPLDEEPDPATLNEQTWIVREHGSGTRDVSDECFRRWGLAPRTLEFSSTQAIKESVAAGLGISLLSEWAVRAERELRTLRILATPHGPVRRALFLVTRRSAFQTKATEVFCAHLRSHAPAF